MPQPELDRIVAAWPSGRWFTMDGALDAALPAPLRKLFVQPR
jgi:hypothetical protein